jgi:hypothetical protein
MKISIDEMPAKVFQLPEVFMTSRLNHNKVISFVKLAIISGYSKKSSKSKQHQFE